MEINAKLFRRVKEYDGKHMVGTISLDTTDAYYSNETKEMLTVLLEALASKGFTIE